MHRCPSSVRANDTDGRYVPQVTEKCAQSLWAEAVRTREHMTWKGQQSWRVSPGPSPGGACLRDVVRPDLGVQGPAPQPGRRGSNVAL